MGDTGMADTMARGPQKLSPTTAMARGLLMPSLLPPLRLSPRLLPTTAVPMADTTVDTMARGQLMPRLTTAMAAMVDMDTAMARGPLMPRLTTASPDTDMADTMERGPLTPSPTMAMAAMVDTDMAMARGPLTPRPTTATPDTDMADTMARGPLTPRLTTASPDTDMADTLTASKMLTFRDFKHPPSQCNTPISKSRHPSQKFYKIRAKIFIPKCQEELM